jgi:hypothetical protein
MENVSVVNPGVYQRGGGGMEVSGQITWFFYLNCILRYLNLVGFVISTYI